MKSISSAQIRSDKNWDIWAFFGLKNYLFDRSFFFRVVVGTRIIFFGKYRLLGSQISIFVENGHFMRLCEFFCESAKPRFSHFFVFQKRSEKRDFSIFSVFGEKITL